jgi:hypothetical protein
MDEKQEDKQTEAEYPTLTFKDFLENSPSYHPVIISDLWYSGHSSDEVQRPDVLLLCEDDTCQGMRLFKYAEKTGGLYKTDGPNVIFLQYRCKNCERTVKSFSLLVFKMFRGGSGLTVKVGEWPPFGPQTPPRLLKLLGSDKNLFLQGRRAELHGLGIGAFTYYRRVVESQKGRLLDEIIKVVKKVETSPADIVEDLTKAKNAFQFTKAIEGVKLAIPQILLIDGQNPLLLLHATLSTGIHDKSDGECLELARSIRLILAGLMERIDQALSEKKELSEAVLKLLQVKAGKGKTKENQQDVASDAKDDTSR